jgi:hypothetical protein
MFVGFIPFVSNSVIVSNPKLSTLHKSWRRYEVNFSGYSLSANTRQKAPTITTRPSIVPTNKTAKSFIRSGPKCSNVPVIA